MIDLWYDKYRPSAVEDFIFKDERLKQKTGVWLAEKSIPHLLFSGPPGTGKTTLGLLLSRNIIEDDSDFMFKNASGLGIDLVRNEITNFCQTGGWNGIKIIMLDEFDNFTRDAQMMLRGLIEMYGDTVRFILTANYPQKILGPLLNSRFDHIVLDTLDMDEYIGKLITILVTEEVTVEDDELATIEEIARRNYPDVRAAIRDLQSQVHEGRLLSDVTVYTKAWESTLIELITNDAPISSIRDVLVGIRKDELDQIYAFLWKNSGTLFEEFEKDAIIVIANEEYKHTLRSFPEIGVASTLIQLSDLRKLHETG